MSNIVYGSDGIRDELIVSTGYIKQNYSLYNRARIIYGVNTSRTGISRRAEAVSSVSLTGDVGRGGGLVITGEGMRGEEYNRRDGDKKWVSVWGWRWEWMRIRGGGRERGKGGEGELPEMQKGM